MDYLVVGVATLLAVCACNASDAPEPDIDPMQEIADEGCPAIFQQSEFPEYQVEISQQHWAALEDEFLNRAEREAMGLEPNPYHPVQLTYNGENVPNVLIKLRGQSSWFEAIELDDNPKMQFVLAFNEIDPDGRFYGVRKIGLDMPRTDASFLRQRLALYAMRRAGVPAQCANNARLTINGEYYGLYTNLEKLDKEFLQRMFGDDDEGDLWKGATFIQTNKDHPSWERYDELWNASNIDELADVVDLDSSILVWAAEATVPHGDGYYNGRANFYVYDHPTRGFMWLPHDLDSALDYLPAETSPLFPSCSGRWFSDRQHWAIVMAKQQWQDRYVDSLRDMREAYDPDVLEDAVDAWFDQIGDAAAADPMKPFTTVDFELGVERLSSYPRTRAAHLDEFLDCRSNGGDDGDGDGYDSCFDCSDSDPAAHPGAEESCNGVDDDCDGQTDELPGGLRC